MYPAGLIPKHQTSINERRRPPDSGLRAVTPDHLALVCRQAIEITVARSNMHSSVRHDRTRPESALLLACSPQRLVLPNERTIGLAETINVTILGGGVDLALVDCGC